MLKRFFLYTIVAALSIAAGCGLASAADPAAPRAVLNRDYLPAVLDMIGSAKKTIQVIQYEYVDYGAVRQIEAVLAAAVGRGVSVRMILDDTVKSTRRSIARLQKKGMDVKLDETAEYGKPGDKTTHAKAILVDGQKLMIGSTNWSDKSISDNNESDVLLNDPVIGKKFSGYFDQIWNNAFREPAIPPPSGASTDVMFNRQYLPTVLRLFQAAHRRIYVVLYGIKIGGEKTSVGRLLGELKQAQARNVDVRIILDQSTGEFSDKTTEFNEEAKDYFNAAGIACRLDTKEIITHAKILIVDGAAVVGGTNWGHGPLDQYNDCNVILKNSATVEPFASAFLSLWNGAPRF